MGFAHEQNRNDRDDNIAVQWENINEDAWVWFQTMGDRWYDSGENYDIDSVRAL